MKRYKRTLLLRYTILFDPWQPSVASATPVLRSNIHLVSMSGMSLPGETQSNLNQVQLSTYCGSMQDCSHSKISSFLPTALFIKYRLHSTAILVEPEDFLRNREGYVVASKYIDQSIASETSAYQSSNETESKRWEDIIFDEVMYEIRRKTQYQHDELIINLDLFEADYVIGWLTVC